MARWTWSINRGNSSKSGVMGLGRYNVRLRELRESTSTVIWLEYLVEDRLDVDGITPSPIFVSCTSGCMRAIVLGTGNLDYCIICCLI